MRKFILLATGVTMLSSAAFGTETIRYIYDAKGRLVRVERTGTVNNGVNTDYEHDRANNRHRVHVTGSPNLPPP